MANFRLFTPGRIAAALVLGVALPSGATAGEEAEYDRPARPIAESLGKRVKAARGSSCWTTHEDGVATSVCGDVFPPQPSKPLRVRRRGVIAIDMRMPATGLTAALGGRRLEPKRVTDDGERWRIRLPRQFRRKPTLSLLAFYSQGDSAFTVTLRRRAEANE